MVLNVTQVHNFTTATAHAFMKSLFRDLLITPYWFVDMSEAPNLQADLSDADEKEKGYDWLGAAKSYNKAIRLASEHDSRRIGEIYERLGYAAYRAAFQAESNEEFKQRMRQAVVSYEKAKELFQKLDEPTKTGRMFRCDAMVAYVGYWLATEVSEKKRLLNECWRTAKDALKTFDMANDGLEYGRTYNQLSASIDLGLFFEQNCQAREKTVGEAVEYGERAVKLLTKTGDLRELARAYVRAATFLELYGYYFLDLDERKKKETYFQKAMDYWVKGSELSEEGAMLELPSVLFGKGPGGYWGEGTEVSVSNFEKALEYGRKTKDKFIVGRALDLLAYHDFWRAQGTEDPDERTVLLQRAVEYAEEARNQYSLMSFVSPRGGVLWTGGPYPQHYWELAFRETDLNRKRQLLEKALEAAPDMLNRAESSGYVDIIGSAHVVFGTILRDLALIETDSNEKKRLLESALMHGNESVRINEQVAPFVYWNRYLMHWFLARIRYELADIAKDADTKKSILQEALAESEESLRLCIEGVASYERQSSTPLFSEIGRWRYQNGSLYNRLYEFTNNKDYLKKATEDFEDATKWFQKLNMANRVAECYWKDAQTHSTLGEHLKAAENFASASNSYKSASEKIPQLKDFYQDHASYMLSWTEIEKARDHHGRQEYDLAKEHFEKASNIHKSLKQWSYLAPNYASWAQLEQAEELSRREQTEEAINAFAEAATMFMETKESLQTHLDKIEDSEEKQMATSMVKATEMRHEYSIARITIEEARILDKKGDHHRSSEKYGSAAEALEKISQALESEQERRELKLIVALSKAWQKMTLAEAEASPSLYLEASELFEDAKEFNANEKTEILLLGHSRFCKALEAGTRFCDARNMEAYIDAVKHLESAANYYIRAGFPKASEYSEATRLLFDAYMHTDNAAKESDPEKRVKLYAMAEMILQTSAGYFLRAEHPEKREQVLGLLEKVKKEQELAASLMEVLHAPAIVSATTSFSTPTPTLEQAVGSERFEHADVQASLIVREKELKIGELLNLEMEFVNAGKGPAVLMKISEIIPKGFELNERPETCRVEDSFVNMKGRRLDPLKTEELKLVLKPKIRGTFVLKPTILYLDENGKYKSHTLEPISIIVKELGIRGWLKGEK